MAIHHRDPVISDDRLKSAADRWSPALRAYVRRRWRIRNPAACAAHIAAAAQALASSEPGPAVDEAIALRDQLHREVMQGRQAALPLGVR